MMTKQQLEILGRKIIENALAGKAAEDSAVELKSEWIPAEKAARRLAAHANAAGGNPLIWLFGIDEKGKRIVGTEAVEMSNWITAVAKHFDGEPPRLDCHANINYEEGNVAALYFETRNAPYVIKNQSGGRPEFEVPFRRGTATRAASRVDLLKILLPKLRNPRIRTKNLQLKVVITRREQDRQTFELIDRFDWNFQTELYFAPQTKDEIVIPHDHCSINLQITEPINEEYLLPLTFHQIGESLTVKPSATEIIVAGPGSIRIAAQGNRNFKSEPKMLITGTETVKVSINLKAIDADPIRIEKYLKYVKQQPSLIRDILVKETHYWQELG